MAGSYHSPCFKCFCSKPITLKFCWIVITNSFLIMLSGIRDSSRIFWWPWESHEQLAVYALGFGWFSLCCHLHGKGEFSWRCDSKLYCDWYVELLGWSFSVIFLQVKLVFQWDWPCGKPFLLLKMNAFLELAQLSLSVGWLSNCDDNMHCLNTFIWLIYDPTFP